MNKKMQKLLIDGDVLKAGIGRGDVIVLIIPKQNKTNDKLMKKRSGILYGNTKFTDEQIIYFYKKHKGNASAASGELRMTITGYRQRLSSLGLKPKGGRHKFTDKQIIDAHKKYKGNSSAAARGLKISLTAYKHRTSMLGLKSSGKQGINKSFSDKTIISAMKKAGNNARIASELVGCHYITMLTRIRQLKITPKGPGKKGNKK